MVWFAFIFLLTSYLIGLLSIEGWPATYAGRIALCIPISSKPVYDLNLRNADSTYMWIRCASHARFRACGMLVSEWCVIHPVEGLWRLLGLACALSLATMGLLDDEPTLASNQDRELWVLVLGDSCRAKAYGC